MSGQVVPFFSPCRVADKAIFYAGITAGTTLRVVLDELEARTLGVNRQSFVDHLSWTAQDADASEEATLYQQMVQALMKEYQTLGMPMKPAPFIQGLIYALQDSDWLSEAQRTQYFSALSARISIAAR